MRCLLQDTLGSSPPPGWTRLAAYELPRLRRRIDSVLVAPGAVLAFASDRATAEAAAIDLADFHEGCRNLPVIPVAMLNGERVRAQHPLPFPGAAPVVACTRLLLPGLLAHVAGFPPLAGFDPAGWAAAAYRPVPGLMEAACALYARHDAAHLLLANSGRGELDQTRTAVLASIEAARAAGERRIVFVTGLPGAGKTLCGLDLAFRPGGEAAYLTGNPALLHVLRAALVRDAAAAACPPAPRGNGSRRWFSRCTPSGTTTWSAPGRRPTACWSSTRPSAAGPRLSPAARPATAR